MALPQSAGSHHNFLGDLNLPILPADIIAQVCHAWSSELRFRVSLPLVSKTWWQPATRGLYKHVVIRRLGQISRLARTLSSKDPGTDFRALVRNITLYRCIAVLPDRHVKSRTLEAVFKRCVALEEVSFHGHPNCEDSVADGEDGDECWWERPMGPTNPIWIFPKIVFPALYVRAPTALRKLDLASLDCWDPDMQNIPAALHMLILPFPCLASLSIQSYRVPIRKLPTRAFLEELHLDFCGPAFASEPSSRAVWMWSLSRLRALPVILNELRVLALGKLGRTLTYLYLFSADALCTWTGFAQLTQLCPALEHVVFHTQPPFCGLYMRARGLTEHLLRIHHLDVWRRGPEDT